MIAAWPGMGFLAKISADYLRRRINAAQFAEIKYFHNVLVYTDSVAKLAPIKHKLYASEKDNIIILVGDAQPSIPEESLRLAQKISDIAVEMGVNVLVGSDAGSYAVGHGSGLFDEMELLEKAGMPTLDILCQATHGNNQALTGGQSFASLEAGFAPRFILTRNNPLETVANLKLERLMVFDGAVADSSTASLAGM